MHRGMEIGVVFASMSSILMVAPQTAEAAANSTAERDDAEATSTEPGSTEEPAPAPYVISVRGALGLGQGNLGGGGRLGGAGEYWIIDALGVGLVGGLFGEDSAGWFEETTSTGAEFIAPTVGWRSDPGEGYFVALLGAGYAHVERRHSEGLCINFGGECAPDTVHRYSGYSLNAALGALFHPGGGVFELGPLLRFDGVGDFRGDYPFEYLVTLNLELGLGLRE